MSHPKRFVIILAAFFGVILIFATGTLGATRLVADDNGDPSAVVPLILAGQKPRTQQISSGGNASFTIAITNTGTIALPKVAISGAAANDCNRSNIGPLAAGESKSYICGRSNITAGFLNELTVTGTAADEQTATDKTDAYVQVENANMRVVKTTTTPIIRQGEAAQFTVALFNTGNEIISNITVEDSTVPDCNFDVPNFSLLPSKSVDYGCSLPNVQSPLTSVSVMEGTTLITSQQLTAGDAAWVNVLGLSASLVPSPSTVPEPGDFVSFQIELVNTGSMPLKLKSLVTDKFGNVLDPANPRIDAVSNTCLDKPTANLSPNGGRHACTFDALVSGQPSNFNVLLTATAIDNKNTDVTATATATVVISNVPARLDLSLGAEPAFINPPGQMVNFSVRVNNVSETDSITITSLEDQFLGSLDGVGSCDVPVASVAPGLSYQCSFSTMVTGQAGQQKTRRITVRGTDDDQPPGAVTDSDTVTVGIIDRPQQRLFLPNVTDDIIGSSCDGAYPLALNRTYQFVPPSAPPQHVFWFELKRSGNLKVEMTGFIPRAGQLVVWGGQCGQLKLLDRDPSTALNKSVNLGNRPAGRYVIQMINDGPTNIRDVYSLIVRFN